PSARRASCSGRSSRCHGLVTEDAQPACVMRVLMISDVYFPRVNGVSTSIQTFRHDLAARGCETWLVAPEYPETWQDDARVLRQPSRYLAFDPEDRMMKSQPTLAAGLALA